MAERGRRKDGMRGGVRERERVRSGRGWCIIKGGGLLVWVVWLAEYFHLIYFDVMRGAVSPV